MEIYTFVLCCALFSSIAAFSVPDSLPEYRNDSLAELAESQGCRCKNGRCVTDNRGKTKCNCPPGFALQDEFTCEPCNCGEKGKCTFLPVPKSAGTVSYVKKCFCDVGSAEKDGTCIDCHCGENSKCEFEGEEKICYCIDGYSEMDGVCTRCDCGFNGECKFEMGRKICTCDAGYLEHNGLCKACNCGQFGTCSLGRNGEKLCNCNNGFSDNNGICQKCDCGQHSLACEFKNRQKVCHCESDKIKRAQYDGRCVDCNCGDQSEGCQFFGNRKVCQCVNGYVQKGDVCRVRCSSQRPCQNGGACHDGICSCLPGTSGEFCEVIEGCDRLCPKDPAVGCVYDTVRQKPVCRCRDIYMGFHPVKRQCIKTCGDHSPNCANGGVCSKLDDYSSFCRCLEGTEGEFCEIVPSCYNMDCGNDATCRYNVNKRSAECVCRSRDLDFNPEERRCKRSCRDSSNCLNGGTCAVIGSSKFCRCLDGTRGDFCEEVPGCIAKDCGSNAKCQYDIKSRIAVCVCADRTLQFDKVDYQCKRTCRDSSECMNGGKCDGSGYSKFCRCPRGTVGDFCEEVPGCKAKDCGYDAKCAYDRERGVARCICAVEGFSYDPADRRCKRTCVDSSNCKNGGTCVSGEFSRFCRCLDGTEGDYCDKVPECDKKNCGYQARCVYGVGKRKAICKCNDERLSFDPYDRRCKRDCQDENPCENGGKCNRRGDSSFCDCLNGTKGDSCEEVEECSKELCKGDSVCTFDVAREKAICQCLEKGKGYDPLTGRCKRTCDSYSKCKNGGLCEHQGDHLFCRCKKGTNGEFCENVYMCKDVCGSSNGVLCNYDPQLESVRCKCRNVRHGFDVTTKTCRACDCGKGETSCSFLNGRKVCGCAKGYAFQDGRCKKQYCTEKRCTHGKCDIVNDEEVCTCYEGYILEGDECRRLHCKKTPCVNGTCIVRHGNREECVCPSGHTLDRFRGICLRGMCRIDTCFGGACRVIDGELTCVCPDRFHLEGIGCFETVCVKQHCFGGKCVVKNDEEICTCPKNHILVNDVCKLILCETKNCFGGKCDVINGKEVCTCPPGFTIYEDVCRENQRRPKGEIGPH